MVRKGREKKMRECPRCNGQMMLGQYDGVWDCLQCGYEKDTHTDEVYREPLIKSMGAIGEGSWPRGYTRKNGKIKSANILDMNIR